MLMRSDLREGGSETSTQSTSHKDSSPHSGGGSGSGSGSSGGTGGNHNSTSGGGSHTSCSWSNFFSCNAKKLYHEVKKHPVIAAVVVTAVVVGGVACVVATAGGCGAVLVAGAEGFTAGAEMGGAAAVVGGATSVVAAGGTTIAAAAGVGSVAAAAVAEGAQLASREEAAVTTTAKAATSKTGSTAARTEAAAPKAARVKTGCLHSFLPDTQVLMADGSKKAIKDVDAGDKVLATDPETGRNQAEAVDNRITTPHDKQFADITVQSGSGTAHITATTTHPFWDDTSHSWIRAGKLHPGMRLHTASGASVLILAVRIKHTDRLTHDLTVAHIHTYYVLAGATPVLVHNCGGAVTGHPAACECADGGIPKVRNGKLAGDVHPKTNVPFDENGFPDFSAWRHPDVPDVRIELSGSRGTDFARSNRAAGLSETPDGYTWHHHQEPGLMQLIETEAHKRTAHTGGFSGGR